MANQAADRISDVFHLPRASRYEAPEFEDQPLPIVYGDLTIPARKKSGVYALPRIDASGGGVYCVAAHEIWGAVTLFDEDGPVAPDAYVLDLAHNYQRKGVVATASFSASPKGQVSAVCKGRKDASGALIENPAHIVRDLMANVWGFGERDLDLQALARAALAADALGYRAGGMLVDDHAPAEVFTALLGDFLGRYEIDPFGRLAIRITGQEFLLPQKALPHRGLARTQAETARDTVVNQVATLYARNYLDDRYVRHDAGEATKDASSQKLYGVRRTPQSPLRLEWVRCADVAARVQARIVERYHAPTRTFTLEDTTLRALDVEPDDYVAFSVPWMRTEGLEPLVNQIGEVLEVGYDMGAQTMELKIRDTGAYLTLTWLLDGSETLVGSRLLGAERDAATYA